MYWQIPGPPGQPHVANFDLDPMPEVFIAPEDALVMLEHDGTVKFGPLALTQKIVSPACWSKPGAVHDFDGDGVADIAAGSCTDYSVYRAKADGLAVMWSASVSDPSGLATGTAFDFLGRGFADAIYADETRSTRPDGGLQAVAPPEVARFGVPHSAHAEMPSIDRRYVGGRRYEAQEPTARTSDCPPSGWGGAPAMRYFRASG